jgi:hypothetical protein
MRPSTEEIVFCPQCGARAEGERFCRFCGANLARVSEVMSASGATRRLEPSGQAGSTVRIFSGGTVSNRRKTLDGHTTLAVFGGIEIDLTKGEWPAGEVTISVVSIFGGTEIIVPDDVAVRVSGITFCGGYEVDGESSGGLIQGNDYSSDQYDRTERRLHVKAATFFGGMEIRGPKKK